MKRWILLLPLLLLLLTGCDKRQQVGICWRDCDDSMTSEYRQALEAVFNEEDYAVTVMDAGNDQAVQDRQVAELMKNKTDILILEPVMTTAVDEVCRQAQEAAVPVVFVNREPDLEMWDQACYIGCDTATPGQLQAQLITNLPDGGDLNGDGCVSYAILAGPEDHLDAKIRSESCVDMLDQMNMLTQCLAVDYGEWTREDAQLRCAKLLAKYGKDLEVIFCNSDDLALGAMDAIADGGRTVGENIYLYGVGGQRQGLLLIRSGDITGTVRMDISAQAAAVLEAAEKLLAGEVPQKQTLIDQIPVDAQNVEGYIEE